jgi:hypothetical protein
VGRQREYKSTQLPVGSPTREMSGSNLTLLSTPSEVLRKRESRAKEFVPHELQFAKRRQANLAQSGSDSANENAQEKVGTCLLEDFLVIAPDTLELRRKREATPDEKELRI